MDSCIKFDPRPGAGSWRGGEGSASKIKFLALIVRTAYPTTAFLPGMIKFKALALLAAVVVTFAAPAVFAQELPSADVACAKLKTMSLEPRLAATIQTACTDPSLHAVQVQNSVFVNQLFFYLSPAEKQQLALIAVSHLRATTDICGTERQCLYREMVAWGQRIYAATQTAAARRPGGYAAALAQAQAGQVIGNALQLMLGALNGYARVAPLQPQQPRI
jgi:hypothetical protein